MNIRVLLDMNSILDHLHKRKSFFADADAVMQANEESRIKAYVAGFSIPTIFYLSVKEYRRTMQLSVAIAEAFADVHSCLETFEVCNLDYDTLEEAWRMGGDDFEDNLQLACAMRYNLDAIVSRDKKFPRSPIPVLTPAELLKRLPKRRRRR